MIIGKLKQYCDKCGEEIENNFFHIVEWIDYYVHTKERKRKRAEVCNKCYEKAFHAFFQCGDDIPNTLESEEGLCYSCVNKGCWLSYQYGVAKSHCEHYEEEK